MSHSRYLETILEEQDLADRPFIEVLMEKLDLGPDEKEKILTAMEYAIGEDELLFEANASVFPRLLQNCSRKLRLCQLLKDSRPQRKNGGDRKSKEISFDKVNTDPRPTGNSRQYIEERLHIPHVCDQSAPYRTPMTLPPMRYKRF